MIYIREFFAGLISPWVVASRPRFARQLQKFAHTELYTHYDIAAVAARQEPDLRAEMERHANDELRHYGIFREWSARVSPYVGANYGDPEDSAGFDQASVRQQAEQAAAPSRRLPELGDYMTYLFLSESRAVLQFRLTRWMNPWNERCWKQIPLLLQDETRHVSYSLGHAWREFRRAPWARFKGGLRVLGYILRQDLVDLLKLIQTVGSGLMGFLLYYGVVTPYGLVMRLFGAVKRERIRSWKPEPPVLERPFWEEF